ncbi:MAG: hypothetical protein NC039_09080 [Muribaculaceae bacterium]|nr:hypothetical protein [Muribaculaceae bacterium]
MNRIPHRSDFTIRFAFSDADSLPVSMKAVDFEMWFMTKPGAGVFMAAQRLGICTGCEILTDGSVLVRFDDHHLPPGQLACDIAIHSDDENMPDGKRDIRVRPVIPVELTEGTLPGTCHRPRAAAPSPGGEGWGGAAPILVNVKIPFSRPVLSRHITKSELDDAIMQLQSASDRRIAELTEKIEAVAPCEMTVATDQDIAALTALFTT